MRQSMELKQLGLTTNQKNKNGRDKKMKKIVCLLLILLMLISIMPSAYATPDTDTIRYTVLVLDTSGSSGFEWNNQLIYTADTAVDYVKRAANQFTEDILKANGTNYVAVISYKSTAEKISDFTDDSDLLKQQINSLSASQQTRDISAGLDMANDLLSTIPDDNAIKNVVLVTTGMTNDGNYSYTGHYDESTIGSTWVRTDNRINLYAYANVAYSSAETVKEKANLYTLGIFQTMAGMPEEGKGIAEFFRITARDLASSEEYFYDIENPEDIEFMFGEIVYDITIQDTDGDGLCDEWESNGIDTDGDGDIDLHLEQMGADPNVPDIFVEIDWMVQPQEKLAFIETQSQLSLAPSPESMRLVYEAFRNHGIQLHIDAGPESIDFVTGNAWGELSDGEEIPYEKNFNLGDNYSHWNEVVEQHFDLKTRANVFRHCLFVNTYNGGTSSGIANGIPGQYFIVANQEWLRKTGDTGIAGTFMHELGHTLGLSHGGHDHSGENNHTHYKPNYLSIMNYLFQTTGLVGTNEVNYSEYELPDLNENYLIEQNGIDPNNQTAGTGLGTKISDGSFLFFDKEIAPISQNPVDFNNLWGIDEDPVSVDLNSDGKKETLTSSNDWEHLIYKGGDIGFKSQIINIAGIEEPSTEEKETLTEVNLEERLESGLLANAGTGSVEAIGPFTLLEGYQNQGTYLKVSNLSSQDTTFTLIIEENELVDAFTAEIELEGSTDSISYKEIRIPIKNGPKSGCYTVNAILKNDKVEDKVFNLEFDVHAPTAEELEELKTLLQEESTQLPDHLRKEYLNTLDEKNAPKNQSDNNILLIIAIVVFVVAVLLIVMAVIIKIKKRKSNGTAKITVKPCEFTAIPEDNDSTQYIAPNQYENVECTPFYEETAQNIQTDSLPQTSGYEYPPEIPEVSEEIIRPTDAPISGLRSTFPNRKMEAPDQNTDNTTPEFFRPGDNNLE